MGDGVLRREIEKLVKELELDESVVFLGNVSNVEEFFQMSDVYVMPSLYEGLPVALMEAQASGLHCVVSDGIAREANVSGNVKFLSLDSDIGEWANELINFERTNRGDFYEIMRSRGYDVKDCIKRLERIYDKCMVN